MFSKCYTNSSYKTTVRSCASDCCIIFLALRCRMSFSDWAFERTLCTSLQRPLDGSLRNRCKQSVSLPGFSCINSHGKATVGVLPPASQLPEAARSKSRHPGRRGGGQPCNPSAPTPPSLPAGLLPARLWGGHVPASAQHPHSPVPRAADGVPWAAQEGKSQRKP